MEGKNEINEEDLNVGHALFVKDSKGVWSLQPDFSVDYDTVNIKMMTEIERINETLNEDDVTIGGDFFIDELVINQEMLTWLIAHWEGQCFQSNTTGEIQGNIERILTKVFKKSSTTVAICVSWNGGWVGSATLEKKKYGSHTTPRLWIHEVCKAGSPVNEESSSPIPVIFETFFDYAPTLKYKGKNFKEVWLFVEKNPDHGFGASLNSLYSKRYGFKMTKTPRSDLTAMKRVVSEKRPDLTEEELIIEEISNAYRTRLKTLQEAKQNIVEDEELSRFQEKYLALLTEKGWGRKPKKTKINRKKRTRRKRTRRNK